MIQYFRGFLFLQLSAVLLQLFLLLSPICYCCTHAYSLTQSEDYNGSADIRSAGSVSNFDLTSTKNSTSTMLRGNVGGYEVKMPQQVGRQLNSNNNNNNNGDNNYHDHLFEDLALRNRDIIMNQHKKYHVNQNNFATSNNFDSSAVDVTSSSNFKVLVILLRWKDHANRDVVSKENIETFFTGVRTEENRGTIPTGSIHDYINTMSYNQLSLQATVMDWQTTDNTEKYYAQTGGQGQTRQITAAFRPLLNNMDSNGFNWQEFDQNNDGILDLVVFMHSGYDGHRGGDDCQTGAPPLDRIATHTNVAVNNWISSKGYRLGNYVVATSLRQVCGARITRLGPIVRVLFHSFGLPYLYDTAGPLTVGTAVGGLGNFDVMANNAGQANKQTHPGHLSAWSKITMGFITPIEITANGVYTITPQETSPVAYKISLGYTPGEYLLIEYRKPIEGDYDQYMYGNGGILIYRINENEIVFGVGNRGRGYPTQQQQEQTELPWPQNGNNYPISLLQADGLYELEQAINGGDEQDFYKNPDQILQPYSNVLNNYPNTDGYGNDEITSTGISIFNFQQLSDNEYSFEVSGLAENNQDTATPTVAPSAIPTSMPTNNNAPTSKPSSHPTSNPTSNPTANPTLVPTTSHPSTSPSNHPTSKPTVQPTAAPSVVPSVAPSWIPSSNLSLIPSSTPSIAPSDAPSLAPSGSPSTTMPTTPDTSSAPSSQPTNTPSSNPSSSPSSEPSGLPSATPTLSPSTTPSSIPSASPSLDPTSVPSSLPSSNPSPSPSMTPSLKPSATPSSTPSTSPSATPSATPSSTPSSGPSGLPSTTPTLRPSTAPSSIPSASPSLDPTSMPSSLPSSNPSQHPSSSPSLTPSSKPSSYPSVSPSAVPSVRPSGTPSSTPSANPSVSPTSSPSSMPSSVPSSLPSASPSVTPSLVPSSLPSKTPSTTPTVAPSSLPSNFPTSVTVSTSRAVANDNDGSDNGNNGPTKATTILVVVVANIVVLGLLLAPKLWSLKE